MMPNWDYRGTVLDKSGSGVVQVFGKFCIGGPLGCKKCYRVTLCFVFIEFLSTSFSKCFPGPVLYPLPTYLISQCVHQWLRFGYWRKVQHFIWLLMNKFCSPKSTNGAETEYNWLVQCPFVIDLVDVVNNTIASWKISTWKISSWKICVINNCVMVESDITYCVVKDVAKEWISNKIYF